MVNRNYSVTAGQPVLTEGRRRYTVNSREPPDSQTRSTHQPAARYFHTKTISPTISLASTAPGVTNH